MIWFAISRAWELHRQHQFALLEFWLEEERRERLKWERARDRVCSGRERMTC